MPAALRRTPAGRVLMTTDAVGGVWTYCLDLARGLARAEIETALVVLGPSPSDDQAAAAWAVPGLSLIDTNLPMDWTASEPAEILEVGAAIRGLARGDRASLIHLNTPALASGGGFSAPVVGVSHSCVATWWSAVKYGSMPEDFRWRTRALWQGLHACDLLAAPTLAFAQEIGRTYDVVTPHVVNNGRALVAAPAAAERQPMVLTSGRLWDEAKNIAVLDAAAKMIAAPLHAAGPLSGPNGAAAAVRHARPLGRLSADEMSEWLARAPIYASAALYEPFGLGVLEAAQAGCALVLADIPTLRELWDGAAVFVAPNDAAGFAAAFERLLGDAAMLAEWSGRAAARATAYSLDRMVGGTLALYGLLQPALAQCRAREVAA